MMLHIIFNFYENQNNLISGSKNLISFIPYFFKFYFDFKNKNVAIS